jgi:1-acyl-sn-glycerol-3-phosphate acyltransferase
MKTVFRGMKAIPVAPQKENPEVYERAFDVVAAELRAGHLVCIFPEGRLTRDGEIEPFRAGMLRILQETPVPVIPMALSGLWGSMFSRHTRTWWRRLPRRLFARIEIAAGEPVAPEAASLPHLQAMVAALRRRP